MDKKFKKLLLQSGELNTESSKLSESVREQKDTEVRFRISQMVKVIKQMKATLEGKRFVDYI